MRVLLVEDNPGDVLLARHALESLGAAVDVATDGESALHHLRHAAAPDSAARPDLVLLDLKIPRRNGLEVLAELDHDEDLKRIPVVVLTSSMAPSDLEAAYRFNVRGCFSKPNAGLDVLMARIVGFVGDSLPAPESSAGRVDRPEPLAGGELQRMRCLAALVDSAPQPIIGLHLDGTIQTWNAAAERLYGYLAHEVVGRSVHVIVPANRRDEVEALLQRVRGGAPTQQLRTVRVDRDGREIHVELRIAPVRDSAGTVIGKSAMVRDITEETQAEDRFRLAVEASPSAMIMVDARGRILMLNAEGERLFGYARSDLIGRSVELLVPERYRAQHPDHRSAFIDAPVSRAMGAGRELYGLRRDGSEVPVEIGLNPIHTREGTVVLCSIVDVSERRKAEERFRLAVEASPSGMVMVDGAGTIVMANAETERMFGYDAGELIGRSVELLVPRRFRGQHTSYRAGFNAAPEARRMGAGRDLFGVRKDGTELPVEVGLNPIETDEGMLVLSTIVDITARKQAEQDLAQQARELARSNADLEEFAYVASHDLQEPLRMVSSYTSLLAERYRDRLDDEARQFIEFAQDGATRMRQLISDLLAYSRVRTRGKALEPVDVATCFQLAMRNLEVAIAERGVRITGAPEGTVLADRSQLALVFQNLLSNAMKFCEGTPAITVTSRCDADAGLWVCAVRDNGIGLPPQYSERVFQMFHRLHTRAEYEGTGIGLALCKRIIERHGGRIWVESDGERGSTFLIELRAV